MKFRELSNLSANDFLRLKPGESVVGTFQGEPYDFRSHWNENRTVLCTGDRCVNCSKGMRPTFRFRLNFIVKENGHYNARILEGGTRIYNLLKQLHEDYDLAKTLVRVTRNGSGTDTSYTIVPLPPDKFSKELAEKIAQVKLHSLTSGEHESDDDTVERAPGEDGISF